MPGFDQLNDIPEERRAALLGRIRALQEREGLPAAAPGEASQPTVTAARRQRRPAHGPRLRRGLGIVAGAAVLAGAGLALLARPTGHDASRAAAPGSPATSASPGRAASPGRPARQAMPSPMAPTPSASQVAWRVTPVTEVAGIGCPDGVGRDVSLDAAIVGLGWLPGGGGWTGDGCDGASAWTEGAPSPTGPSTLTWAFHPQPGASRCTLTVYVPTENALGEGDYAIATSSGTLAVVPVDQAASSGQWITLGTYPVSGPAIVIQLAPRVAPPTPAATLPLPAARATSSAPFGIPVIGLGNGNPVAASAAQATCG
jgi:hypothetical protein